MLIVVLVVLVLAAFVLIGVKLGLFKIEKIEIEQPPELNLPESEPPEGEGGEEGRFDLDGPSLKEKMELNGYFDGEGREGEEEAAEDSPQLADPDDDSYDGAEGKNQQNDRISDFKTGRVYLIEGQKSLTQAKAEGLMYAAASFDFDRFRFINNLKGLSIGDYVLTNLSHELENVFPAGAMMTRVSADHFAVIFPLTDNEMFASIDDHLKQLCEKIRNDVAMKGALRISMGVALTSNIEKDYDIQILLHKANVARHCIKVSRSETYRLFEDAMLTSNLFGESALEDYGENQYDGEFVIYYTPQEELAKRRITGCEALVRWSCEDDIDKKLPPSIDKSMIPTNSSKVIYQVCKTMSRWRKAGKQVIPVSVAVPITELYKADCDEFLAKVLSEFQLEPALLHILVDAPMVRLDWSSVSRQLNRITHIGVKVGVDGIDTGYSNLDFLRGLPASFIKLHRSFTAGIDKFEDRKERARSIINQAKEQDLTVYCEGVENKEEAAALHILGVRVIQGSYCGRPRKGDDFIQGLPEHIERQSSGATVILDDSAMFKGDYKLY